MPVLENRRHELFSQGIAKGENSRSAYLTAGFNAKTDGAADAGASRLLKEAGIQARVAELQERAAVRTEVTVAGLTKDLQDLQRRASANDSVGHLNTARQCIMDIAKLNGKIVDRSLQASASLEELLDQLDSAGTPGDAGAAED